MKLKLSVEKLKQIPTPFYYYYTDLLQETLSCIKKEISRKPNYKVHYAIKVNFNPKLLKIIHDNGFGVDCVSGG